MKTRTKIHLGILAANAVSIAAIFAVNKFSKESNQSVEALVTASFNRIQKTTGIEASLHFGEPLAALFMPMSPIALAIPKAKEIWFCYEETEVNRASLLYRIPKHILIDVILAHEFGHLLDPTIQDGVIESVKDAELAAWRLGEPLTQYKWAYHFFNFNSMTLYWVQDAMEKVINKIPTKGGEIE